MTPAERARLSTAPVGRLATIRPSGGPHLVVVTFALAGDDIVTAVDHKPKRHQRLQRLTNIESEDRVSFLVDHWDDDWDRLWWIRLDGTASVSDRDAKAVAALAAKYRQYREQPPEGPVIRIEVESVTSWSAS